MKRRKMGIVGPESACNPSAPSQLAWSSSATNKEQTMPEKPRSLFSVVNHVGDAYYILFVLYFSGAHHHSNNAHRWKSRLEIPQSGGGCGKYGGKGLSLIKTEKPTISSTGDITVLRGYSNGKNRFSLSLRATIESSLNIQ